MRVRVRVRVFINTQHFQNMLSLSASHPSSSFSSSYNSSLQRRTIKSPSPIPRRQHRVTTKTSTAALSNGQKVALHYKLTNGETNELIDDTSTRGQPVEITLGSGELFPKLEEQLLNFCKVGSKIKVTLDPEDTYGNFDDEKIQKQPILPEEMAQVKEQVQPGQVVMAFFKEESEFQKFQFVSSLFFVRVFRVLILFRVLMRQKKKRPLLKVCCCCEG